MPTIMILKGFRFFFYSNEHLPKHIHAIGKGGEVKIELDTLKMKYAYGLKEKELKTVLQIVKQQRFFFLKKWDEYHTI